MDWSKAKSTLIISFLLVDLYLAWLLFAVPRVNVASASLTSSDLQGLITLGEHFGVKLAAPPIPLKVSPVPSLSLAEQANGSSVIASYADIWLIPGLTPTQPDAASFSFTLDQWVLWVIPSRFSTELRLEQRNVPSEKLVGTEEANVILAKQFLSAHLGPDIADSYQPSMVLPDAEQGQWVIEFNRFQNGLPFFTDYYRVYVQSGQVRGFLARLSELDTSQGHKMQIVTADRPMKRYLTQVELPSGQAAAITDFRLGYGLIPGNQQTLQPVWRLTTTQPGKHEVIFPAGILYWGADGR